MTEAGLRSLALPQRVRDPRGFKLLVTPAQLTCPSPTPRFLKVRTPPLALRAAPFQSCARPPISRGPRYPLPLRSFCDNVLGAQQATHPRSVQWNRVTTWAPLSVEEERRPASRASRAGSTSVRGIM